MQTLKLFWLQTLGDKLTGRVEQANLAHDGLTGLKRQLKVDAETSDRELAYCEQLPVFRQWRIGWQFLS